MIPLTPEQIRDLVAAAVGDPYPAPVGNTAIAAGPLPAAWVNQWFAVAPTATYIGQPGAKAAPWSKAK